MPRKGYEEYRRFKLNPDLVGWAMKLSADTPLKDSDSRPQAYRLRYPDAAARRAPFVGTGTHMTGDTFFHGPGMSKQAQYIAKLYGADDYVITEMEAAAITLGDQAHPRHRPRDEPARRRQLRPGQPEAKPRCSTWTRHRAKRPAALPRRWRTSSWWAAAWSITSSPNWPQWQAGVPKP